MGIDWCCVEYLVSDFKICPHVCHYDNLLAVLVNQIVRIPVSLKHLLYSQFFQGDFGYVERRCSSSDPTKYVDDSFHWRCCRSVMAPRVIVCCC